MARTARRKSFSGYYHIILRGVNKQDIFLENYDREYFIRVLRKILAEDNSELVTYCLMRNHVHLLIHSDMPGTFIKRVAASYVFYFNRKYDRVGHLFQERFKSEPVEDERYMLTVFRYILRNPQKAGICRADEYPWNGWHEVCGAQDICTFDLVLDLAGGVNALRDFVLCDNEDQCMDADEGERLTDENALEITREISRLEQPEYIGGLSKDLRDRLIRQILLAGVSSRQLSRMTHISRDTIRRIQRTVPVD